MNLKLRVKKIQSVDNRRKTMLVKRVIRRRISHAS